MTAQEIETLINNGEFKRAKEQLIRNPQHLNYIDPESQDSLLMITAIVANNTDPLELQELVEFFLSCSDFRLVNHHSAPVNKTAFDLFLGIAVPLEVIQCFIHYHQANGDIENAVFKKQALLDREAGIPPGKEVLKFEYTTNVFNKSRIRREEAIAKKNKRLEDAYHAQVLRYSDLNELLEGVAINYAIETNDETILQRIRAVGGVVSRRYPDGTNTLERALRGNKDNIVNFYTGMSRDVTASTPHVAQNIFARTQKVAELDALHAAHIAAQTSNLAAARNDMKDALKGVAGMKL